MNQMVNNNKNNKNINSSNSSVFGLWPQTKTKNLTIYGFVKMGKYKKLQLGMFVALPLKKSSTFSLMLTRAEHF